MDDKRNTDNAWIETLAMVYADKHDLLHRLNIVSLEPADLEVLWMPVSPSIPLRHSQIKTLELVCSVSRRQHAQCRQVAELSGAHWDSVQAVAPPTNDIIKPPTPVIDDAPPVPAAPVPVVEVPPAPKVSVAAIDVEPERKLSVAAPTSDEVGCRVHPLDKCVVIVLVNDCLPASKDS